MWKKKQTFAGRHRGVLLMEVIVAMVVLSIGITAVMRSFSTINRLTRATGNAFYAVQRIENLLWEAEENREKFLALPSAESTKSDERGEYRTTVFLENISPAGLKDVRAAVSWSEPGRRENIELQAFYYQPPIEDEGKK